MTPAQLRAVADRLRRRYPYPDGATMRPGEYLSSEAMYALAWALDEQAAEEER